ncbi:hypothetical protein DPX16_8313 [Anabarilius grahami]|uniref:Uncharacterized protein n=1 Tax=Anabarilius grahami TaxID=495550 RepID=A0A3N0YGE4_ANAGA|nr:hypothetical protein DPX16_8313 [Anabarilius grahami]
MPAHEWSSGGFRHICGVGAGEQRTSVLLSAPLQIQSPASRLPHTARSLRQSSPQTKSLSMLQCQHQSGWLRLSSPRSPRLMKSLTRHRAASVIFDEDLKEDFPLSVLSLLIPPSSKSPRFATKASQSSGPTSAGSLQFLGSSTVYSTLLCGSSSGLSVSSYALALGSPGSTSSCQTPVTPPRLVDQSAPHWLLPPLNPPGAVVLMAPLGSFIPLTPPWAVVALSAPQTSGSSAALCPSTLSAPSDSTFPLTLPWSSVTPALLQSSGTLSPPHRCGSALASRSIARSHQLFGFTSISSISVCHLGLPAKSPQ